MADFDASKLNSKLDTIIHLLTRTVDLLSQSDSIDSTNLTNNTSPKENAQVSETKILEKNLKKARREAAKELGVNPTQLIDKDGLTELIAKKPTNTTQLRELAFVTDENVLICMKYILPAIVSVGNVGEGSAVSQTPKVEEEIVLDIRSLKLYEELKVLRSDIASEEEVPPYRIFPNKTLTQLAYTQPTTPYELISVKGIGPKKLEVYGESIIKCIVDFKNNNRLWSKRKCSKTKKYYYRNNESGEVVWEEPDDYVPKIKLET